MAGGYSWLCGYLQSEGLGFESRQHTTALSICNLYSITTNQEAIRALFRVINRCKSAANAGRRPLPTLPPSSATPAPSANSMMRWGITAAKDGRAAGHQHQEHPVAALARLAQAREPLPCSVQQLR